jgi:hypothetical protein
MAGERHGNGMGAAWHVWISLNVSRADPSGHAVKGAFLRSLAYWDGGFESGLGHGCLSVVSVVFCQVEVSVTGR